MGNKCIYDEFIEGTLLKTVIFKNTNTKYKFLNLFNEVFENK
jgi:hypothetical protein